MPTIQPVQTQLGFQAPRTPGVSGGAGGSATGGQGVVGAVTDSLERIALRFQANKEQREKTKAQRKRRESENAASRRLDEEFNRVTTPPEDYTPLADEPDYIQENADVEFRKRALKVADEIGKRFPEQAAHIREFVTDRIKSDTEFLGILDGERDKFFLNVFEKERGEGDQLAQEEAAQAMEGVAGNPEATRLVTLNYLSRDQAVRERAKGMGIDDQEIIIDRLQSNDEWFAARYIYGLQRVNMQRGADEFKLGLATGRPKIAGVDLPFLDQMTEEEKAGFIANVDTKVEMLNNQRIGQLAQNKAVLAQQRAQYYSQRDIFWQAGGTPQAHEDNIATLVDMKVLTPEEGRIELTEAPKRQAEAIRYNQNLEALTTEGNSPIEAKVALSLHDGNLDEAREDLQDRTTNRLLRQQQTSQMQEALEAIDNGMRDPDRIRAIAPANDALTQDLLAYAEARNEEESEFATRPWMTSTIREIQDPGTFGLLPTMMQQAYISTQWGDFKRDVFAFGRILDADATKPEYQKQADMAQFVTERTNEIKASFTDLGKAGAPEVWQRVWNATFRNDPQVQDAVERYADQYSQDFDFNSVDFHNWKDAFRVMRKRLSDDVAAAEDDSPTQVALAADLASLDAAIKRMDNELKGLRRAARNPGTKKFTIPSAPQRNAQ